MTYVGFKDLTRRTASDKILRDKAFNVAKNPKYDGYQRGLYSMVYKFFHGNSFGGASTLARSVTLATRNNSALENENISNKELADEIHKPINRKFKKRKVRSPFTDNIWGTDIANMQIMSKFNKGIRFLL